MSRGLGRLQSELLRELRSRGVGAGLLPGDKGGNMRRAAHRLAELGLVRVGYLVVFGRRRLVIRLVRRPPTNPGV